MYDFAPEKTRCLVYDDFCIAIRLIFCGSIIKRKTTVRVYASVSAALLFIFLIAVPKTFAVVVSTVSELKAAIQNANDDPVADRTIQLADGTYHLDVSHLWIERDNVTVESVSGNRDGVILQGQSGMNGGDLEFIFQICADHVSIRNMTLEDVGNHAIIIQGQDPCDADFATMENLIIRDTYEQMIKATEANDDPDVYHSEGCIVDGCLFEYTTGIGPQYYIGGIDVHAGKDWIVRNNTFKYIRSPQMGVYAEHAVHFWSWSRGTLVANNNIIDCDRGIGFGMGNRGHTGGVIRNNRIYHADLGEIGVDDMGDVGIIVENTVEPVIYNNTVWLEHNYANGIEYRFSGTTGAVIANNLTNKLITGRDGASGTETNNAEEVDAASMAGIDPADPSPVFLHIRNETRTSLIDQGTGGIPDLPDPFPDIDGDVRPYGTGIDIGADEFVPLMDGDVNADHTVTPADSLYLLHHRLPVPGRGPHPAADTNGDDIIDAAESAYLFTVFSNGF
jgi:hypothetical protein